jgi:hypothetical protein
VVRPDPIPNSAVKRSLADGSGCIASARVGCRQILIRGRNDFRPFFFFDTTRFRWDQHAARESTRSCFQKNSECTLRFGISAPRMPSSVFHVSGEDGLNREFGMNRKISVAITAQWSNFLHGLAANCLVDNCGCHRGFVGVDEVPSAKTQATAAHSLWLQFAG